MPGSNSLFYIAILAVLAQIGLLLFWLWRRRQIDARQEAEAKYRNIYENAQEGIYQTSLDGKFLSANPALARIFNYPSVEALIKEAEAVQMYVDPERRNQFLNLIEKNKVLSHFESQAYRRDKSIIWISENVRQVLDNDGQVRYFEGTIQDITARKEAEEALRVQKRLFESLVAVARATSERPTLEDTLRNILDVTSSLTEAQFGSLFIMDREGMILYKITQPDMGLKTRQQGLNASVMTQGLAGWVAKNRQAGLIYDTEDDERWVSQPNRRTVNTRSALSVPILNQKELLGILTLTHGQPYHFDDEHLSLLQAAADQMSLALRNAQIFDALRHTADLQITLYEVMRIVTEQTAPQEVQRMAVEVIAQYAGWRNVAIVLHHPDEGLWRVSAGVGIMASVIGESRTTERGIIGQAILTGETQIVNDVQANPAYLPAHPDVRSELAVPMKRGERILGVIDIESLQVEAFDNDDVILVNLLADAVGLALDNAYLYTETERQLNQQIMQSSRLKALIEASRDGIMFIGHTRRIFVVNQPTLRLLNWPGSPQDWTDRDVLEVILETRHHSMEAARMMSSEVRRLARGDFSVNEGTLNIANRYVQWLNLPVTANENEIGRLIVLHDATEQHLLENMREDLTHTMVHDLRNPVSAIYTSLHLIEEMLLPISVDQKTTINVAHKNIQKMLNLIDHILDVSRLEGRRMPLSLHPVDLVGLAREAVETQMPLAQSRHLSLTLETDDDIPPASADATLVSRVLQNLVGNAIKFTPPDGQVTVKVAPYQAENQLLVSVRDTGPGIDIDIQKSIFQKFVTGRRPESGSGLGLTFCKLVIDAHEGRIWVESQPGEYTTFFFTLPPFQQKTSPTLAEPLPE